MINLVECEEDEFGGFVKILSTRVKNIAENLSFLEKDYYSIKNHLHQYK